MEGKKQILRKRKREQKNLPEGRFFFRSQKIEFV